MPARLSGDPVVWHRLKCLQWALGDSRKRDPKGLCLKFRERIKTEHGNTISPGQMDNWQSGGEVSPPHREALLENLQREEGWGDPGDPDALRRLVVDGLAPNAFADEIWKGLLSRCWPKSSARVGAAVQPVIHKASAGSLLWDARQDGCPTDPTTEFAFNLTGALPFGVRPIRDEAVSLVVTARRSAVRASLNVLSVSYGGALIYAVAVGYGARGVLYSLEPPLDRDDFCIPATLVDDEIRTSDVGLAFCAGRLHLEGGVPVDALLRIAEEVDGEWVREARFHRARGILELRLAPGDWMSWRLDGERALSLGRRTEPSAELLVGTV